MLFVFGPIRLTFRVLQVVLLKYQPQCVSTRLIRKFRTVRLRVPANFHPALLAASDTSLASFRK